MEGKLIFNSGITPLQLLFHAVELILEEASWFIDEDVFETTSNGPFDNSREGLDVFLSLIGLGDADAEDGGARGAFASGWCGWVGVTASACRGIEEME